MYILVKKSFAIVFTKLTTKKKISAEVDDESFNTRIY